EEARGRRPPCRPGTAAGWRAVFPPGYVTTSAATQWLRADRGPRCGTSSCRYRCRLQQPQYRVSETWRAPCLGAPDQLIAGGAGARPDHSIRRHIASRTLAPDCVGGCARDDPATRRGDGERRNGVAPQSILIPANLTTSPHLTASLVMCLRKSAGELAKTVAPKSTIRFRIVGSARAALISLLSRSTISTRVFAGAPRPTQPFTS